jgi:hypothetical protein
MPSRPWRPPKAAARAARRGRRGLDCWRLSPKVSSRGLREDLVGMRQAGQTTPKFRVSLVGDLLFMAPESDVPK